MGGGANTHMYVPIKHYPTINWNLIVGVDTSTLFRSN